MTTTPRDPELGPPAPPPQIVGLLPTVIGLVLSLSCRLCGQTFTSYQTSLAGVTLGRHTCPQCREIYEIWPEDFEEALAGFAAPLSLEEMTRLTGEASRIAEHWHRVGPLPPLLTYKGVNLGEAAERALMAFIVQGLYVSCSRGA